MQYILFYGGIIRCNSDYRDAVQLMLERNHELLRTTLITGGSSNTDLWCFITAVAHCSVSDLTGWFSSESVSGVTKLEMTIWVPEV